MTIGTSLFLVAVGAILRYAVTDAVEGVDLAMIGLILMIVGVVGAVVGLFQTQMWTRGATRERRTVVRDDRY